jgi:serine/threonine-protein kinase RsbW
MEGEVVELEIPARAEFVALARLLVSAVASGDSDLADERVDDLKIAVSEACSQAIESLGAIPTDERVLVRICNDVRGVEVRIEDRGSGFDPSSLPEHPPITDPNRLKFERGLGIPLIRALVDELEITSSDDGTAVRLFMRHEPIDDDGAVPPI